MKRRSRRRRTSVSNRHAKMASLSIQRPSCMWFFNWHIRKRAIYMHLQKVILSGFLLFSLSVFAQFSVQQGAVGQLSNGPATMDQAVDLMIQHEQALMKNLEKYSPVV